MLRFILSFFILSQLTLGFAQSNSWNNTLKGDQAFVKNIGQFDRRGWEDQDQIQFGLKMGSVFSYFTSSGLTYRFEKFRKEHLKQDNELDNNTRRYLQSELINVEFLNANPNVVIEALDGVDYTFSYGMKIIDSASSLNNINGFKRIKYSNIYDNIDIEYFIHPVDGIKYNVILHSGANPNDIQLKYSSKSIHSEGEIDIQLLSNGDLSLKTELGYIIEKEPLTFYSSNNVEIISNYVFANNILYFQLENYDNTQTVTINTNDFVQGFYLVNVYSTGKIFTERLIKN